MLLQVRPLGNFSFNFRHVPQGVPSFLVAFRALNRPKILMYQCYF